MTFLYLSRSCIPVTAHITPELNTQANMQIHKDIYHLRHYVLSLPADYLLLLDLFRKNQQNG